jgi:hypothetical protein
MMKRVSYPLLTLITMILPLYFPAGCASDSGLPLQEAFGPTFLEVEKTLLESGTLRVTAVIQAEGVVVADLKGELQITGKDQITMEFKGTYMTAPVILTLKSDGKKMTGGSNIESFNEVPTEFLKEGIVVGLMRAGILHNLACLSGGAPPNGTDGKVRDWVKITNIYYRDSEEVMGVLARPMDFDITVADKEVGKATLWIHEKTGLPLQRKQTVRFETGEMHVTESYGFFAVSGE